MELVENVYVSAFTKATLGQFGWKEGDAIPADLGQLMIKMKETLPASKRADVLVDKDVMTDEQVKQIKDLLREARDLGRKKKRAEELDEQTKNMLPDVADLYKKLESAEPVIVDDLEETPAEQKEVTPPPQETAPEQKTEDVAAETPTDTAPTPGDENLADLPVAFCPRCGWDLRMKFEATPTDRDKEDFLATLLGGTRFKKTYELFGGRIVVTFRSLLAEENKLIYRQLVLDQQENRVATEAEWFVQMMDYRLACSLETISDKSGKVITVVPTLDEMAFTPDKDKPLGTPLPQQLALINKNLAQEATRRLVGTHLRQFQRLVEGLEAMALEPSFWNGIA